MKISCTGKVRFKSFTRASTAAKRKPGRDAYACRFCHGYHVGTKQFAKRPPRRELAEARP